MPPVGDSPLHSLDNDPEPGQTEGLPAETVGAAGGNTDLISDSHPTPTLL